MNVLPKLLLIAQGFTTRLVTKIVQFSSRLPPPLAGLARTRKSLAFEQASETSASKNPKSSLSSKMNPVGFFSSKIKRFLLPFSAGLLIILIPTIYLATKNPPHAEAAWFDDTFGYRQTVTITNSGTTQTDYQIDITLDTAALTTAGKIQSDCDDIRITDYNGKTLPHWIETGTNSCNTTTTKIWTKIPSLPTPNNVLFIYYGNPSAPNTQEPAKVFQFFDDFSGGQIDTAKWNTSGSPALASGTVALDNNDKIVSTAAITDASGLGRLIFRAKQAATNLTGGRVGFSNTNTTNTHYHNDDAAALIIGSTEEQISQTAGSNLVSHHKLEETTSTDANQFKASGYYDTGKLSQAVSVYGNAAGTTGSALSFPRGAQISGNNYEHINTNQGTVSFWVKPSWNGNDNKQHQFWDSGINYLYIYKHTNNHLYFEFLNGGITLDTNSVDISNWTANNWYHVVVRWDTHNPINGSNYVSITINDTNNYMDTTPGSGTSYAAGQVMYIGSDDSGQNQAQALIDDFAIFDRVLTTTEISNIYNSGTGREAGYVADPSIKFYAKLDGSGTLSPVTYNAGATFDQTAYNASTNTNGNMVTNSGMESASGGIATGWSSVNGATLSDSSASNIGFDTRSQLVTATGTYQGILQNVSVQPNTNYYFSVQTKATGDGTAAFFYAHGNISGTNYLSGTHYNSSTSWSQWERVFKTDGTDTSVDISIRGSNGSFNVDNVVLVPISVDNGGTEGTYSSGIAPGWTLSNSGTGNAFEETTTFHSGTKAQKITSDASANYITVQQSISVTSGNWYLLSFWVYSDTNAVQYELDQTIEASNGGNTFAYITAGQWNRVAAIGKASTTGNVTLSLARNSGSASKYWILDDVSVIPLDNTALSFQSWTPANSTASGSEKLANGNMETGDPPSNWSAINGATTDGVTDERTSGTGAQSIDVTRGSSDNTVNQSFATVIGETYKVAGWYKNTDATLVRITAYSSNLGSIYENTASTSWTETSFYFTAKDTTTYIYLNIVGTTGQKGRFDDISVKLVPNPLSIHGDSDGVTSTTSGARGNAYTFDGSTGYLRQKTYDTGIGTLSYADSNTDISDDGQEFEDWDNDDGGSAKYMVVVTNSDNTTSWGYFCANDGGTQTAVYTKKACSGGSEGFNGTSPSGKTPVGYEVRKTDYQITGNLTMGAWVKADVTSSSKPIMGKGYSAAAPGGIGSAHIWLLTDSIYFSTNGEPGTGSTIAYTSTSWNFVVGVFDGSSTKLYVNGSLSDSDAASAPADVFKPFVVAYGEGSSGTNKSRFFTGSIDSPFVIGTALTADQIKDIYNSTAAHYGISTNNAIANGVPANSATPTNDTNYATYVVTSGSASSVLTQGSTTIATSSSNLPNSGMYIRAQNADSSNLFTLDWVAVAKQASTAPTVASPANEQKSEAPVAYWKFDDGTGSSAQDSSPNNNDGTISGATWKQESDCISGKCLSFDGSDDYVGVPHSNLLNLGTNFTLNTWVRVSSIQDGSVFISTADVDAGRTVTKGYSLEFNSTAANGINANSIMLRLGTGSWKWNIWSSATNSISANKWHHVVVSIENTDTASKTVKFYINGVLSTTTYWSGATEGTINWGDNTSANRIGSFYSATDPAYLTNYLNGFIDDVKIYNYARTAAQIKSDYRARGTSKGTSVQLSSTYSSSERSESRSLSDGLVGYWKMDESSWTNDCSTTSVTDSSGNGNNGKSCPASTGPTGGAAGKFGNAGSFDGSDDGILVTDSNSLDIDTNGMTLSAWVNLTTQTSDWTIADKGNLFQDGRAGYTWLLNTSRKQRLAINDGTEGTNVNSSTPTAAASNTASSLSAWNHVSATWNPITQKVIYYLNGQYDGEYTTSGVDSLANNQSFYIAIKSDSRWFKGSIDEVRIYNRALSPREVRDLYNWAPGPVGYWNFDEKSGQTANDISGNANTGTLGATSAAASDDPSWTSGKFGGGLSFDGSNDYVNLGTTNFTTGASVVSVWIKPNASQSKAIGELKIDNTGMLMYIESTDRALIGFREGNAQAVTPNGSITINSWNHIVFVYMGGSKVASNYKIYINGVEQTLSTPYGGVGGSYSINQIGNENSGAYFNGSIDDVRIYNYARTQKQIVEDMNAGHPAVGSPVASAIAHYKFDEGYGTTANNSGNGGSTLNGTITGATWTNVAKFDKAIKLTNGVAGKVNINDNSALDLGTGNMTLSAWINTADTGVTQNIIRKDNGAGYSGYIFRIESDDRLRITFSDASNAPTNYFTGVTVTDGKWHHVVAVYNRDLNKIYGYVDGVLKTSPSITLTGTIDNGNALTIGGTSSASETFGGTIDDVKIYNYALTEDEIRTDYNRGVSMSFGGSAPQDSSATPGALSNGLVGWWKMDESAANSCTGGVNDSCDSSGAGNDLAHQTTFTSAAGKFGNAQDFEVDTSDYLSINDNASLSITGSLTIAAWINTESLAGGQIVAKDATGARSYYFRQFETTFRFVVSSDGTNPTAYRDASTTVTNGSWIYVVAVYDSVNRTMNIYRNGVLDNGTLTGTVPSSIYDSITSFRIGNDGNNSGGYFDGKIDDVRIYNRALSAQEVEDLYNWAPGPVAEWKMDEKTGQSVYDSSGNGNTGTLGSGGGSDSADPTWTQGKVGAGLSFDGSDDYVNASIPNPGSAITIEFFSRTDSYGGTTDYSAVFDLNSGYLAKGIEYFTNGAAGSRYVKIWGYYSSAAIQLNKSIASIDGSEEAFLGKWHHYAAVFAPGGNKLYIDGQQVTTDTNSNTVTFESANTLNFGRKISETRYLHGKVDQFKIYNYARTPAQIAYDYNRGAPVGWWKFDECQGETMYDASGNGNNGTWSGSGGGTQTSAGNCSTSAATAWYNGATGKRNSSLNFDGTDDYINISSTAGLIGNNKTTTIAAWVNTASTGGVIYGEGNVSNSNPVIQLEIYNSKIYAFIRDNAGTSNVVQNLGPNITNSGWTHLAMTVDENGKITGAYVNGRKVGSATSNSLSTLTITNTKIGVLMYGSYPSGLDFFNGQIDDVRVYNYALSPSQVKQIYNDGAIRFGPSIGSP